MRGPLRHFIAITAFAVGTAAGPDAAAAECRPEANIFVLGALHGLHETEDSFSYDVLRSTISSIRPDVLVLEVRPDELSSRSATPGRPEYPAVIWPLLDRTGWKAVAMEPGGEEFSRITGAAGNAIAAARQQDPSGSDAVDRLDRAIDTALAAYWDEPADAQDDVTAVLAEAGLSTRFRVYGPTFQTAQQEWDAFMAGRASDAARVNPCARVLVLSSFRNRATLSRLIAAALPGRVADMERFLRDGQVKPLALLSKAEAAGGVP